MLRVSKARYIGFFWAVFAYTAVINQATAGLTITVPVSASDPLILPVVTTAVASSELATMRNLVAADTIKTQSTITYTTDPVTGEEVASLPMLEIMQPLMQAAIMKPLMESLSDPTNPDGAVYLFAPDFVTP